MTPHTIQQVFDLAVKHHQAGRLQEAEQLYRQVLVWQPNHAVTIHLLGVIAFQVGQNDLAVDLFHRAATLIPNCAEFHDSLGNALRQKGRLDEAVAAHRQAITLKPNYPEAYSNLGNALHDKGELDGAIAAYSQAIALNPTYADPHNNLGSALQDKGQLDEAITAYRRAIALKPSYAQAHSNLGNAMREKGQLDEAIAACRQAVAIAPNLPEAHNNLGVALRDKGQLDEAIAAYRQAIALRPNYGKACNNLGVALGDKGDLDEATIAFRQAVALMPNYAESHHHLGTALEQAGDLAGAEDCYRQAIECEKGNAFSLPKLATLLGGRLPDKDVITLKSLLADPSRNVASRIYIHFALAYVLDARQCYGEAAEHLRVGHALCRAESEKKGAGYDAAAHAQFVSQMIDTCSAEFFQRMRGMGLETRRPVFIVGLPRSGTTLTEQILAGHSQIFGAGELTLGQKAFLSLAGYSAPNADLIVRADVALQGLRRLDRQTIQHVAQWHLKQLERLNSSAARIVDKMPGNYLGLGLLAVLFPQAQFIHCRRDLRDVAVSCWMTRFDNMSWHNDLEHITTRFEQYRRVMEHWRKVLGGKWLDCDYEQTVADLPGTARRLVDWCGLEWEPACLNFHLVKRPVRTPSLIQVREPIYTRSVGRWRHYQELLAPVLDRLSGS